MRHENIKNYNHIEDTKFKQRSVSTHDRVHFYRNSGKKKKNVILSDSPIIHYLQQELNQNSRKYIHGQRNSHPDVSLKMSILRYLK